MRDCGITTDPSAVDYCVNTDPFSPRFEPQRLRLVGYRTLYEFGPPSNAQDRSMATVMTQLRENRTKEGTHRFYRFRTPLRGRRHRFYRALPFLLTTCNRNVTEM